MVFTVSQVDKVIVKDQDGERIPSVGVNVVHDDFILDKSALDPDLGTSEANFNHKEDSEPEDSQQSKDTSDVGPSPEMSQTDPSLSGSPSNVR